MFLLKDEQWRVVKGYENMYEVSNFGRVKSLKFGEKILKTPKNGAGYYSVNLYKNGHMKGYFVHRLVAETFIENPLNLSQVNHKDENKTNNNPENLEWCTNAYNQNYGSHNENVSKTFVEKYGHPLYVISEDGTDYFFRSIREASKELSLDDSHICKCLKGKYKTHKGYTFESCR